MIDIKKLQQASHVLLVTKSDSFSNASALYSYLLTLHKKVSLHNKEELESRLSFLPWFEKCRVKAPSSADYVVEVERDAEKTFHFFKKHQIKINAKMATALYAGMLLEYDAFVGNTCDGTTYASVSELIQLKADYKRCNEFLLRQKSLALFRLKSLLFGSMLLSHEATVVTMQISEDALKSTGASMDDALEVMRESLNIAHVKEVRLLQSDAENRVVKIIKDSES